MTALKVESVAIVRFSVIYFFFSNGAADEEKVESREWRVDNETFAGRKQTGRFKIHAGRTGMARLTAIMVSIVHE